MDGNASTVYVQQASSLLRLGPLGWQRIFFNRFGDSLLLYPRHIQLYKILTLSLACVILHRRFFAHKAHVLLLQRIYPRPTPHLHYQT